MKLHGEEVKVKDRVWDILIGWGTVDRGGNLGYPIFVRFDCGSQALYMEDGRGHINNVTPTLFWQPIVFEMPKKPKQKEKAWQWIYKFEDTYYLTNSYYTSKEEVSAITSVTEPIEPYLPSEIERDKS